MVAQNMYVTFDNAYNLRTVWNILFDYKILKIHMEDCVLVSYYSHVGGPECQLVSDRFNLEFIPMETLNRNGLPDGTI